MFKLLTDDVKSHVSIGGQSVDVFLPEYSVAIEYQGKHHYEQQAHGHFIE
jgi:very-short-patch-repair endonuclease